MAAGRDPHRDQPDKKKFQKSKLRISHIEESERLEADELADLLQSPHLSNKGFDEEAQKGLSLSQAFKINNPFKKKRSGILEEHYLNALKPKEKMSICEGVVASNSFIDSFFIKEVIARIH